jgi:hypothetical protein
MFEQRKTARIVPDKEVFALEVEEQVPRREAESALWRHLCGDWGELDPHWRAENEEALQGRNGRTSKEDAEINSIYTASNGVKFCITTFMCIAPLTMVYLPEGDEYFLSPPFPPNP